MSNPVLVTLSRGGLVESTHTGSLVVMRPNGEVVVAVGDIARPIFPRSAVKAMQALPLVETGAADRYGFDVADLALACASHSGTPAHTERAASMLARAQETAAALACGAHEPVHEASARLLFKDGRTPSALHNNCSGKHAGMVCTCVHCGDPVAGYLDVAHPHQQRIAKVMADFFGDGFDARRYGIDGCSAPNWAIPLRDLARGFAVYTSGDGLTPGRRAATARIVQACMARPDMVAGPERMDTLAMTALQGRVFMKTGAEGVYCGGVPARGLGFALKIDDGNKRASEAVMAGLIERLFPGVFHGTALGALHNAVGRTVGETALADAADSALDVVARAA